MEGGKVRGAEREEEEEEMEISVPQESGYSTWTPSLVCVVFSKIYTAHSMCLGQWNSVLGGRSLKEEERR